MRITSSRAYNRPPAVPTMPPGLVDLMDGLARDVLMHNPSNVYEFCAKHMEKLLEIRDGPSTKKMVTVEQKIQKAQEKMRQKSQERREKFDQGLILRSDNDIVGHGERDTQLVVENLSVPGPSFKAPIHHEVNLDSVSEVEISLASQIKNEVSSDEIVHNTEYSKNATTVQLEEPQIPDIEIEANDGLGQDTECIKKIDDEPLFGKVENENIVINAEPLKEPYQEEIDLAIADSPLQTITETSEENLVTDPVILPKITIGDDHDLAFFPEEQHYTAQLGKNDVFTDHVASEENLQKSLDISDKNGINESDDSYLTVTQNDAIIHENDQDQIKMTTDLDGNTENINEAKLNTKQLKDDDISEMSLSLLKPENSNKVVIDPVVSDEIHNNSIAMSHTGDPNFLDSSSGQVLNESGHKESIVELHETETRVFIEKSNESEIENISKPNQVILNTDANQIKTDNASKTETDVKATENITDKEMNTKLVAEEKHVNVNVTTNDDVEMKSDIETDNMISDLEIKADPDFKEVVGNNDTVSNVINIDAVTVESETMAPEQGAEKESMANLDDKNTDNTEMSLLKSDSTENTNEDSLSMVESDLSRTEDNPNMDLETAAVTIQKVFRSFMFKSRNSTFEDPTNDEHNSVDEDNDKKEEYYAAANLNKDRRTLGITRMDTVLQTVNEEKSLSLSTDDSSTLSSAATTIQAHVRGFLVRNRLNSSKTYSMNSLVNSHEVLEAEAEQHKNKTILNIHIVPEEGNYLSRDESLITSMDLSLDGSPPSSVNLHPLSCDISERRKMLKREDAVQSVSPPSNNSGKLSEDSVKEILINENGILESELTDDTIEIDDPMKEFDNETSEIISSASTVTPTTIITISKSEEPVGSPRDDTETGLRRNGRSLTKLSSDESDVITPFVPSPRSSEGGTKLVHSGEFHDVVLPTKVSRNDTSAVRGE